MELRHLRYFVAVAEELHFGRAARKLSIAQPPLSQQIRRLEEELGVQLFERTQRQVRLTHAGQALIDEARRTLAQAAHAMGVARKAALGEVGRLAVGFVDSAVYHALPPVLRGFRERYPQVELVLRELGAAEQFRMLREGHLHVGFVRSRAEDPALTQQALFEESLMAAVPCSHPLARRENIRLSALAGDSFVIFPRPLGPGFYDQIVSLCRQADFSPRVVQEANEMQTIVSLVAAGIGVAIVPASISNLRMKGVAYLNLLNPGARTAMTVAWRRDDPSPVLRVFLHVVRQLSRAPRRHKPRHPTERGK